MALSCSGIALKRTGESSIIEIAALTFLITVIDFTFEWILREEDHVAGVLEVDTARLVFVAFEIQHRAL